MDKRHRICTEGCALVYELLNKAPSPKEIRVTVYDHDLGFISKAYVYKVDQEFIDGSRGGSEMSLPENKRLSRIHLECDGCRWGWSAEVYHTCKDKDEEEYPKDIYGC